MTVRNYQKKYMLFFLLLIFILSLGCDTTDRTGETQEEVYICERGNTPEPPLGTPDDTDWYKESMDGLWAVTYQYFFYDSKETQVFLYWSDHECCYWYLKEHKTLGWN